jgi:signal transduction histidine kinase
VSGGAVLSAPGPGGRRRRWPWLAVGVFAVFASAGMALVASLGQSVADEAPFLLAFGMFAVVGALILSRDPGNRIGGLFLYASFMTAASFLAIEVSTYLARRGDTGSVLVLASAIVSNAGWILGLLPALVFLLLLFPDGRLLSRRWLPYAGSVLVLILALFVSEIFGAEQLVVDAVDEGGTIPNPMYAPAVASSLGWLLDDAGGIIFSFVAGGSILSLAIRFRRSRDIERQQMKWFLFACAFLVGSVVVGEFMLSVFGPRVEPIYSLVVGLAYLSLPTTVGVAVLRYRLFDLDVVVRKTLVYASLAVFATLVYLAVVVGVGTWFGRDDPFFTMVAAVVVAVTFQPMRDRLTRFANRLVYGRRATPYEVLAEFSERVGDAYADEDVLPRMARVLGEGVGAERADVWLTLDDTLHDVAVWPPDAERSPTVPLTDDLRALPGAQGAYRVERAGELLGALAIRKPANDPMTAADDKLVRDLAGQAGLVLSNVRLTEELKARIEELRAAHKRLVTAQDEERRRLERNIHDGAQQQLVALAVKLRLTDAVLDRDLDKAHGLLAQLQVETTQALDDLRDLARGIYPPLLADKGLVAALESQIRRSPIPIDLDAPADLGRFTPDVEATIYFSCLEALQNVVKYAHATKVRVRLAREGGDVTLAVTDDGRGFDPSQTGEGTGLRGMRDRITAVGGTLEIVSAPGRGATVAGRLPAPAMEPVS